MSECLHCDINELVEKHIEGRADVDVSELAAKVAESLADLILLAPPGEQQANLLAHTIAHLGDMFLQKSGSIEGGSDATH
jgi:hypothetical protein